MGYAQNIGRVGALAIALGVGFGVGTPLIARADDDTGSSAAQPAATDATAADEPTTQPSPVVPAADPVTSQPDSSHADAPDTGGTDPRDGIVQASGGAEVRVSDAPVVEPAPDVPATSEAKEPDPVEPTPEATVAPEPHLDSPTPTPKPEPEHGAEIESARRSEPEPASVAPTTARIAAVTPDPAAAPVQLRTAALAPASSAPTLAPALTPAVAQPTLGQLLLAPITSLINGVFHAFGLGPVALPPGPPMTPFPLFELVFAAFRRIESTLSNHSPSATYTSADPTATGIVTGRIVGADTDGDALTYTLTGEPDHGTVTLDRTTGEFTYTPDDANWAQTGQPDQFTVTVSDATNFHVHPAGSSHTTTVTVDLDGPPESDLGQVRGTLDIPNPNNVPLTYQVTDAPPGGSVTVDSAGNYVFTPTPATRHQAARLTADDADKVYEFQVRATGEGVDTTVTVTAPISPANEVPDVVESPTQTTDPGDGAVTGRVVATDADGDPLDVTTDYDTSQGSLDFNSATGVYTYTPTPEARHAAAATAPPAPLAFRSFAALAAPDPTVAVVTFTFADGYGGVTTQTVSVPISPLNEDPDITTAGGGVPNPADGVVTGTVTAADDDEDPLTFAASDGARGSVVIDENGNWTYTPTYAARHAAVADGASVAAQQDTFTITVDDGHGGTGAVDVTVSLVSTTAAPTYTEGASVPFADYSRGVAVSRDGRYAYVIGSNQRQVTVIDSTDGSTSTIELDPYGVSPSSIAVSGDRLYIGDVFDSRIAVYDLTTGDAQFVEVGAKPRGIAVDGTRIYVANNGDGTVSVIDAVPTDDGVEYTVDSIDVGGNPYAIAAANGRVVVTDYDDNNGYSTHTATVIDAQSGQIIAVTPVGYFPSGVAMSSDGTRAFVVNNDVSDFVGHPGTTTVIDTATGAVVDTLPIGGQSIAASGGEVYVVGRAYSDEFPGGVSVIDEQTLRIVQVPVAGGLAAFGVGGDHVFITDSQRQLVHVIAIGTETAPNRDAANSAPAVTISQVGAPDPTTGAVTFQVSTSDADGDAVTLTATPPLSGTVTDLGGGQFRYTPSNRATEGFVDHVGIVADDGHGGVVSAAFAATVVHPPGPALTVIPDLRPGYIATAPDGSRGYFVDSFYDDTSGQSVYRLVAVDAATGSTTTLDLPGYADVQAVSPDGQRVYLTGDRAIVEVNTATGELTSHGLDGYPGTLVAAPDGSRLYGTYFTDSGGQRFLVFDTATSDVTTVDFTDHPDYYVNGTRFSVQAGDDGQHAYVLRQNGNGAWALTVVDTSDLSTVTIDGDGDPSGLAVRGTHAYVATNTDDPGGGDDGTLHVVDLSTGTVHSIPLGDGTGVDTITVNPVNGEVYAAAYNYTESNDSQDVYLLVIDPATDTVTAIETDGFFYDMAVTADGTRLISGSDTNLNPDGEDFGAVQIFDTATRSVTVVRLSGEVAHFALSADGSRGYAATVNFDPATDSYTGSTLTIVDLT